MKKVLFLAPNYKYIRTTVGGIINDLSKHKIPFETSVPVVDYDPPKEPDPLYLKTDEVEVIFNHDDPVTWSIETLAGIDAVYGKKELVETLRENFPSRVIVRKDSVQRYIVRNTLNVPHAIIDDIHPVKTQYSPEIKNVYFNDPMTIVIWDDGTKTMVKCQDGDLYFEETGLALCIAKKALGNKGNFNNVFRKWCPEPKKTAGDVFADYDMNSKTIVDAANDYLDKIFDEVRSKFRGIGR